MWKVSLGGNIVHTVTNEGALNTKRPFKFESYFKNQTGQGRTWWMVHRMVRPSAATSFKI